MKLRVGKDFTVSLAEDIDKVEVDRIGLPLAAKAAPRLFAQVLQEFQRGLQQAIQLRKGMGLPPMKNARR